ncbi:MAG: MerR family transcriptional regulator [Desulfovibrio sp.]|nr:MerR family transcriptional regulator [Desulfovibrio sp.]
MQPVILRSLMEICVQMGVGPETVRRWRDEGAPIALEGSGGKTRYSCEAAELQAWRLKRSRENILSGRKTR